MEKSFYLSQLGCGIGQSGCGIGQSANRTYQFGQTERAAHDQKVHPQRTKSVWPDTALSPEEVTHVICELADLCGQLCMIYRKRPYLSLLSISVYLDLKQLLKFINNS